MPGAMGISSLEHRAAALHALPVDHDQLADVTDPLVLGVGCGKPWSTCSISRGAAVRHVFQQNRGRRRRSGPVDQGPGAAGPSAPRSGRSGLGAVIGLSGSWSLVLMFLSPPVPQFVLSPWHPSAEPRLPTSPGTGAELKDQGLRTKATSLGSAAGLGCLAAVALERPRWGRTRRACACTHVLRHVQLDERPPVVDRENACRRTPARSCRRGPRF